MRVQFPDWTCHMAEGKVEYLTEWPPQEPELSTGQKRKSMKTSCLSSTKKPKTCSVRQILGQVEQPSSSEEIFCLEEKLLITKLPLVPITTILAQWWKLKTRTNTLGGDALSDNISGLSHNPHTLLHHMCKLPEAGQFLTARARHLESQSPSCEVYHALSTVYHHLRHYSTALKYARLTVEGDPGNKELEWHLELLKRQNDIIEKKNSQLAMLSLATHLKMPQYRQVERRSAADLSCEEFVTQYALTHTPVVITDITDRITAHRWTFDYIKQVIGKKRAPLKRLVPQSVEWARLEPAGESTVSDFIDSLVCTQTQTKHELKYLFDWSLPLHCPELAEQLTIPGYFANDFLQRTPPGTLYRDSWPSLFVSPAGITSELHVDAFGSNFWMALFQGKKRWVFFPPEDLPVLSPTYTYSTDAVFEVSISQPDLSIHPLLSLTHPTECVLSPGELLFVPAGSPHRVDNLEPSLAISANYVDCSNIEGVLTELRVNALKDDRADALLHILEDPGFDTTMDYEQSVVSWKEFKTWPRSQFKK